MTAVTPDADHDAVLACLARHQVVVAPPGTGKTFLSVRLAGQLAAELPEHARVLVLTFSNQARSQLEQHAERLLDRPSRRRILITNYHRFFWRGIQAYREALGLPPTATLSGRAQRIDALLGSGFVTRADMRRSPGLYEALAEHQFEQFRDERTPAPELLAPMLDVIHAEQTAGSLIFDDFGALFWRILIEFPSVGAAYRARFPVVIADEHQDASALQDAVVRYLGSVRLVVLSDLMQLIHGFRGADASRMEQHVAECDERHELRTPHRWGADSVAGLWLLAVRTRLQGGTVAGERPSTLAITSVPSERGRNGMLAPAKFAVLRAFRRGAISVAVLARTNAEVDGIRDYLARSGLFPRQIGGDHVDRGLALVRDLPGITEASVMARRIADELEYLVPTLPPDLLRQLRRRIAADGIDLARCGSDARALLAPMSRLYEAGVAGFFNALAECLSSCADLGHHLARTRAVRAITETANLGAEDVISAYSLRLSTEAHITERTERGLFVMTLHQAKGKEFEEIILVNASAEAFPDEDESARLFYVGITRGRQGWTVVHPQQDASPLLSAL